MTHDQTCTFDPKWCSSCKLQAEARADERQQAMVRIMAIDNQHLKWRGDDWLNGWVAAIGHAMRAVKGEQ